MLERSLARTRVGKWLGLLDRGSGHEIPANPIVLLLFAPACLSSVCFVGLSFYLLFRHMIWPPNKFSPLLPKIINDVFDIRTRISLVPPEGQARTQCFQNSHVVLGPGSADRNQKRELPRREVRLLKELIADMVEILIVRHELGQEQRQAPEVIWLPLLIAQLRRIMVLCIGAALDKRVSRMHDETQNRSLVRATTQTARQIGNDLADLAERMKGTSSLQLNNAVENSGPMKSEQLIEAVREAVSVEELQDALLGLEPTLVNRRHAGQRGALRQSILARRTIFKHIADVAWIFDDDQLLNDIARWQLKDAEDDDEIPDFEGSVGDFVEEDVQHDVLPDVLPERLPVDPRDLAFVVSGGEGFFRRTSSPYEPLPDTAGAKVVEPTLVGKCTS